MSVHSLEIAFPVARGCMIQYRCVAPKKGFLQQVPAMLPRCQILPLQLFLFIYVGLMLKQHEQQDFIWRDSFISCKPSLVAHSLEIIWAHTCLLLLLCLGFRTNFCDVVFICQNSKWKTKPNTSNVHKNIYIYHFTP